MPPIFDIPSFLLLYCFFISPLFYLSFWPPMSGEALDEEADYGRLPFDIFVAVSFPNPLLGSDLH